MKRKAPERIRKYASKIDGKIIGGRYESTKDLSVGKQKPYFASAEKLEKIVKQIVDGEPVIFQHYYIAYAEELAKKTIDGEKQIVFEKWRTRGLDISKLNEIGLALIGWSHELISTSQGPNSPGTMADDAAVGTIAWVNPDNAKTSNNSYSTISPTLNNQVSHYLKATNFGFGIPAGATIKGILVEIEKKGDQPGFGNGINDDTVSLVIGGAITGDDKSIIGLWSTIESYVTYGGAADLWSETPSVEDINAADFGVVLSIICTKNIPANSVGYADHIRITVYYDY